VAKRAVHDVLAQLGLRVRRLREQKELTQRGLADKADVSTKRLGELERGVPNASIMTAVKVAEALGVPMYSLFAPDQLVPPSADPAVVRNFELAREAFNKFEQSMGMVPRTPAESGAEPRYERPKRVRPQKKS